MLFPSEEQRPSIIHAVIFEIIKLKLESAVLIRRIVDFGLSGMNNIFLPF